jgi:hypothetical protein
VFGLLLTHPAGEKDVTEDCGKISEKNMYIHKNMELSQNPVVM